jgi:hypothetical protein
MGAVAAKAHRAQLAAAASESLEFSNRHLTRNARKNLTLRESMDLGRYGRDMGESAFAAGPGWSRSSSASQIAVHTAVNIDAAHAPAWMDAPPGPGPRQVLAAPPAGLAHTHCDNFSRVENSVPVSGCVSHTSEKFRQARSQSFGDLLDVH